MGATIPEQFADAFIHNRFGVITGSASSVQFPSGTCHIIRFKASPDNVGTFFVGNDADTCVFPLDAGDDTGWNSLSNLNQLYHRNPSGTLDYLYYWLQV
jgi:hypothetical protein